MTKMTIIIAILLTIGCQLLPKVKIPVKNLEGIKTYNLEIDCNIIEKHLQEHFTICNGGIAQGQFYCDNVQDFVCPPDNKIFMVGFDTDSFPKLDSYIQYLFERFNDG